MVYVEVRGQLVKVGSFLPSCGSLGQDLGDQSWQQEPLPIFLIPDFFIGKISCKNQILSQEYYYICLQISKGPGLSCTAILAFPSGLFLYLIHISSHAPC